MALSDFVKAKSKRSLLSHLKSAVDDATRTWRRDAIDAFVSHEELEDWFTGGGGDHGLLGGLSDDDHAIYLLADGTRELSANWDAGAYEIRAETLESDVTTGTAPLTVASTTVVTNLNADLLDGNEASAIDYSFVTANDGATNVTAAELEELTDASVTALHSHAAAGGSDTDAIHDNVAQEIEPLTNVTPAAADVFIIEDQSDSWNKKETTFADIEGAIDHGNLLGLTDDDHTQYILHSLADAANDFLVASGADTFVKKTLAETGAILEADLDHGNIQGLGDDDHSLYLLASDATDRATFATNWTDLTDAGSTTLHTHAALSDSTLTDSTLAITVYNGTGSGLALGDLVYISGDQSGTPSVTKADADAEATCSKMLVMVNATIANAASGEAIIKGFVTGLSGLTAAAIQYAHTNAGETTETAPSAPGDIVRIVGYAMTTTSIYFDPDKTWVELP